jgi:hypothetical protein
MGVEDEEFHPYGWLPWDEGEAILRGASAQGKALPPIANISAQITCCHAGPVVLFPKQTKVMVGGAPALRVMDVAGNPTTCPVPPSPASKPCTTSTMIPTPGANASTKVMIQGMPALLGNPSVPGITDGAPVPCPTLMVMFPGQVIVNATS